MSSPKNTYVIVQTSDAPETVHEENCRIDVPFPTIGKLISYDPNDGTVIVALPARWPRHGTKKLPAEQILLDVSDVYGMSWSGTFRGEGACMDLIDFDLDGNHRFGIITAISSNKVTCVREHQRVDTLDMASLVGLKIVGQHNPRNLDLLLTRIRIATGRQKDEVDSLVIARLRRSTLQFD